MKVFINTIMKNESKHIDRFYECCKFADGIYVLDTGSTDDSVEKLQAKGSNVFVERKEYRDFLFDVARNDAKRMLPDEEAWVINLDLDEFLIGDWETFLKSLPVDVNNVEYLYAFDHEKPEDAFMVNKVARNGSYIWDYPIHECIFPKTKWNGITTDTVRIHQIQDKSKPRNYKKILESCIHLRPDYLAAKFYLLKEFFNLQEYGAAIDFGRKILNTELPNELKMASWLLLYRCYIAMDSKDNLLEECLYNAYTLCPYRREPYMDLMRFYAKKGRHDKVFWAGNNLFNITYRSNDFYEMTEAWNTTEPHNLFINACVSLGYREIARRVVCALNNIMVLRNGMDDTVLSNKGLLNLIQSIEGENTLLEVGCYTGESTEIFSQSPKITSIIAVDPWLDGEVCDKITFTNMKLVEQIFDDRLANNKKIIKLKSKLQDIEIPEVDMVYIDAIHTYEAVKKDLELVKDKVRKYISGHDYSIHFPGVIKAVDEFANTIGKPVVQFADTSWLIIL